ncbi:sugar phosphate isomerase/epimerase [Nonomuraea polychroma]|uniref:Sugar phosphate isomerase/epimerase n=1 Tax=Nonomuraea polychroma TaxID=46176 RepID=A0A438M573_9ACTN|nr:sugar phosphate isomerase/epimerase [Nonomuraea polychroma]RVX40959.1 sugar phosphate isomerase/epimerase [Nonomuraea polychroma]
MKLGAYTACLHDKPLTEALAVLKGMGLESAEINSGGFIPEPHLPIDGILASAQARQDYLGLFDEHGITLTALNCNGNPLHPNRVVREKHSGDLLRSLELAALLGVKRVVTMSGTPAASAAGSNPAWNVLPWDSAYLDVQDYQWNEVAIPFWKTVQERAAHFDVKVAIEMHPHNVVYNPATLERLVDKIHATHVGAEMDPSHLFWQGIDPVEAIGHLGSLVYNAAAKDTRINPAARVNGVLDDRFGRVQPDEPGAVGLGGPYTLSRWPQDSSWDFVAVGRGHDIAWWTAFLQALEKVDPDMAVNIEHEDQELDQLEGLAAAAKALLQAAGR